MLNILLIIWALAATPLLFLGLYVFIKVILMPNTPPADRTNRINHLRVVFYAIQSPEKFIKMYPWLGRDEDQNVKG